MKNCNLIIKEGFEIYNNSIQDKNNISICIVKKDNKKYVCFGSYKFIDFSNSIYTKFENNYYINIFSLNWQNYEILCNYLPNLKPIPSNNMASYGLGDRLGLVTAAHLQAIKNFNVFPVISQQSPRELDKEHRTFKSVLLDTVMGILEVGYSGTFGADADHIKSEDRLIEGIEAGFSMYTIDVSDMVIEADFNKYNILDENSIKIINDFTNYKLSTGFYSYVIDKDKLTLSAIAFQEAMKKVINFNNIINASLTKYDLEVSIDEGKNTTTFEDHLFCAAYLQSNNIDIFSIAPKFPGKFQKALDYIGSIDKFAKAAYIHGEICRIMGYYKLSLHSGSDKFSIYNDFKRATSGLYHIKTSGTSYLRAIILTAYLNKELFNKMYSIAIDQLEYNKQFYEVNITLEDFPKTLDNINIEEFINDSNVTQLFHISYGSILDELKDELYSFLNENESNHYCLVSSHIKKHLMLN